MTKVAICITVHNRHETARKCVNEWLKHIPTGALLIVVDDGSDAPFKGANFRFETAKGIAYAKNKCIELAMDAGAEHIFLSDDDTWPITYDWYKPYVNSPEKHLMFTFPTLKNGRPNGNRTVVAKNGIVSYINPCGCLLYIQRDVINKVGGFDTRFNRYGHEHVEYSNRIHNVGLTNYRYQDVPNSLELFHSMDWAGEIKSSVTTNRTRYIFENTKHFARVRQSKAYIPYKQLKDVVITTYFTSITDPQRGHTWNANSIEADTATLRKSCDKIGVELVILTDNDIHGTFDNPYIARWFAIQEHLRNNQYRFVFCVDATDVEFLRNPFPHLDYDKLYLGDEQGQRINNFWLTKHHSGFSDMYKGIPNNPLLNAGVCGGSQRMLQLFINTLCDEYPKREIGLTDMALFNYVAYRYFKNIILHGEQLTTKFKAFRDNGKAWIRHK